MRWEILSEGKDIIKTLLKNRKIKNRDEFFNPIDPDGIKLTALGIKQFDIKKVVKRIDQAKLKKQKVIVYGDYDADGICATAILWEALHNYGVDALPYIPDRFEEGYGINPLSIKNLKLKNKNLGLVITIDNGIVAYEGIETARELKIDTIVIDHHTKGEKTPKAYSILHNTSVCGSVLAYLFAKELNFKDGLGLSSIGTIADQMSLTGINRSIAKYGLKDLTKTRRIGLKKLFDEIKIDKVGTYEINYLIAPRINAMGRLKHGIESLRLLCTRKADKAMELAKLLGKTNSERQNIVDSVVKDTLSKVKKQNVIVISGDYNEGVIGLAAGRIVEEYYHPAIVISKGEKISKGSARSISGFNIIQAIRDTNLILQGGGHPMAAGFSIETKNIEKFIKKINKISDKLLTDELLEKKLKIDCELKFEQIGNGLYQDLQKFEPFGQGNYSPLFYAKNVEIIESKKVGQEGKHLKLKLKQRAKIFDAIWFNAPKPPTESLVAVAFSLDENVWNNKTSLQLKVRDITVYNKQLYHFSEL